MKPEAKRVDVGELRRLAEAATRGQWRWRLNRTCREVVLESTCRGYEVVIDFARWGMNGAKPRFRKQTDAGILMTPAEEFAADVPGREHHSHWHQTLNHPDAAHIAACCPDVVLSLLREIELLRSFVKEMRTVPFDANPVDVAKAVRILDELDALEEQS